MPTVAARDRLIVALDLPEVEAAAALVERLGSTVTFYKIGLELVMAGGLNFVRRLTGANKAVFLDMKLLDIENTVERATRAAAATGATFLTVHALNTKTVRAAAAGRAGTRLRLLG
ncbi:MAG: orotidine 5'-phosphate decarboxylase, partial [Hyphomicrobiaceae bacterium]|nr:orotidine 5'-phosphate decarboxylase [Hyphomicrobiaceae bacterium]